MVIITPTRSTFDTKEESGLQPELQSLPNPLIGEMFLAAVKGLNYTKASQQFLDWQLVCKKFQQALREDSRPLLALLRKQAIMPLIRKAPPLPIVRALNPVSYRDRCLVREYYTDHLGRKLLTTRNLEDTLPYLENLLAEDRDRITLLNFSLITKVPSESTLRRFLTLLPNLNEVVVPNSLTYQKRFFSSLGSHAPKLTTLVLQKGMEHYLPELLAYCNKVSSLKINSMGIELTGATLSQLLTLPLRTLHIRGASRVELKELQNSPRTGLKELVLTGENFKDEEIAFLIQKTPELNLLSLCLSGCKKEGIKQVLASSLPLKTLDLSHLPVQDGHFLKISESLQLSLQRLILCHCKHLTTEGIESALRAFPKLRYLDLRYSDKVDKKKIALQLHSRHISFRF